MDSLQCEECKPEERKRKTRDTTRMIYTTCHAAGPAHQSSLLYPTSPGEDDTVTAPVFDQGKSYVFQVLEI